MYGAEQNCGSPMTGMAMQANVVAPKRAEPSIHQAAITASEMTAHLANRLEQIFDQLQGNPTGLTKGPDGIPAAPIGMHLEATAKILSRCHDLCGMIETKLFSK